MTSTKKDRVRQVDKKRIVNYSSTNAIYRTISGMRAAIRIMKEKNISKISVGSLNIDSIWASILCILADIELIIFVHGNDFNKEHGYKSISDVLLSFSTLVQHLLVIPIADTIVCNSSYVGGLLREKNSYCEGKMEVVNPGIFVNDFERNNLEESGKSQNQITMYSLGRLVKRKGFDKAIQAYQKSQLMSSIDKYIISGEGPYMDTLNRIAGKSNTKEVYFTGFVEHERKVELLVRADIFVMPSRKLPNGDIEGYGIVLAEACACGCIVIAGRDTGSVDVVVPNKNGLLVDGSSVGSIRRAMNRVIRERQDFWEPSQIREHAVRNFSWTSKKSAICEMFMGNHS
ncbi:glycosyltransferase family 4 protein [Salinibacter sp.]|uniref:glycosyltransferase family 4 protein n=1 Tax=Salinibacter sp. TaxID=2065818 RepID=UPI0021E8AE48|nr:glycosyltransferase family 4 protein [Salinibacter sp.]